jgi:hypothetical protein
VYKFFLSLKKRTDEDETQVEPLPVTVTNKPKVKFLKKEKKLYKLQRGQVLFFSIEKLTFYQPEERQSVLTVGENRRVWDESETVSVCV